MNDFAKYTPINTSPNRSFEADVTKAREDEEDVEIVVEDDIDTGIEDADAELEALKPKEEEPKLVRKPEAKKPHRSQKRIMQLANEKRELAELLDAERRKNAELEAAGRTASKSSKEATRQVLVTTIDSLNKQLRDAMVNGDADATVELQDKVMDAKMQLAVLSAEITNTPEPVAPKAPVREKPQVSEKAIDWIDEHPSFKTDPVFHGAAMAVNNALIREGFDPDSEDFYEELNERLAPKFPEVFGDQGADVVESELDDSSDTDGEEPVDVKPKAKPSPKQTVASTARPSGKGTPPRKSEKVTLTQAELVQAHRLGISPEKYALRKMHLEKNRSHDGFTPIFINKD